MSWFKGVPSNASTDPSLDESGNYKPLKRNERKLCWEARDQYFSCLDRNNILDALKDGQSAQANCAKETDAFEKDCASSWVKYFKQKRVADYDKSQRIKKLEAEGAIPLSEAEKPKWKFW